jgi:aldose 1-epimerase
MRWPLLIAVLMVTMSVHEEQQNGATTAARGVTRAPFGTTRNGQSVEIYTLTNAHGVAMRVITYGGIITSLKVPDRNGHLGDVVLGFDTLDGYVKDSPYFGAIIGRYGNRIAKGRFTLGGKTFTLATNNGPNHLHGGVKGFDKVVWTAVPGTDAKGVSVTLSRTSPDGEEGYPGNLHTTVRYTLTDENAVSIEYRATTDQPTPVNLTQHSYFNLADDAGGILAHELTIHAARYTPVDETLIPTGELASVQGTPFDFRQPTPIGARIDEDNVQLKNGGGYDHNWVIDRGGPGLEPAARLVDPKSGRTLEVSTTEPGIQFYTGNFLGGITGKSGRSYGRRAGLCLETQHFPDSPNRSSFPSTILRPGETYSSQTVLTFGVQK